MSESIEDRIQSISDICKTARGVWLLTLGLAAYAVVALSGVIDLDFFSPARKTQLPIVNFLVPTQTFLLSAPLLLAIMHGYFHLYLARLWREIGELPPTGPGEREWRRRVTPWIVADMAFAWRPDAPDKARHSLSSIIGLSLGWWLAPIVISAFVWRSFAMHDLGVSLTLSGLAMLVIVISCASYVFARDCIASPDDDALIRPTLAAAFRRRWSSGLLLAAAIAFAVSSWAQTIGLPGIIPHGGFGAPYEAHLRHAAIVPRPSGWVYWREAEINYLAQYYRKSQFDVASDILTFRHQKDAMRGFRSARRLAFDSPLKPKLNSVDLRNAEMIFAFGPSIDFLFARLDGADMQRSTFEGAVFRGASQRGTDLDGAHLEAANFTAADMRGASLSKAWLTETVFAYGRHIPGDREAKRCTDLSGSAIHKARVDRTDFSGAILEGAYLKHTDMRSALGLTQEQLNWTIGDETTLLPKGLFVPSCYLILRDEIATAASVWGRTTASAFRSRNLCSDENPLRWFPPRNGFEPPKLDPAKGQFCPAGRGP